MFRSLTTSPRFLIPIIIFLLLGFLFALYLETNHQHEIIDKSAQNQVHELTHILTATEMAVGDEVKASMKLLMQRGKALGPIHKGANSQVGVITVPNLIFGSSPQANHYELVDGVTEIMGGTATIFAKSGENFVRISTNVETPNGARGIGTMLDPEGKVAKALRQGQYFYGVVDILGSPYITGYEPLRDEHGEIVGAWYVGYKADMDSIKGIVANSRFLNTGFQAVLDYRGKVRFHSGHLSDSKAEEIILKKPSDWKFVFSEIPDWGYKILTAYPEYEATTYGLRAMAKEFIFGILFLTLLLGLIFRQMKSLIYRPLGADPAVAKELVNRISMGDLTDDGIKAPPGSLLAGLSIMRSSLKSMLETIAKNNDELRLAQSSLDYSQDAIFRISQDARIMYVNEAACRHLGYSKNELLAFSISDFNPDFTKDAWHQSWENRANTGWSRFETRHKRKDGTIVPVEITATLLEFEKKNYSFASVRDITERKQAEAAVHAERQFALDSIVGLTVPTFVINAEHQVLVWNHACEQLTGVTASEVVGTKDAWRGFYNLQRLCLADLVIERHNDSLYSHYDKVRQSNFSELGLHAEGWFPAMNGKRRYLSFEAAPIFNAAGQLIAAVESLEELTHLKEAEADLRLASIAFETHEAIMITDADANIIRVNRAFVKITGYSAKEVLGQNPRILRSERHDQAFYAQMWQQLLDTGNWTGEIWDKHKDGHIYPKWLTITAVKNDAGETTHYVASFSDISEWKLAEEEIHHLAFNDALTGLPNRRLLLDRLNLAVLASARSKLHGALIFLDLDNFKTLNDSLGHEYGDLLLIEVAHRIKLSVREVDTVARLGGDEFVVLIENISEDAEDASQNVAHVAEKIRAVLATPYQIKGKTFHSSPSIGVCLFYDNAISTDELLKHADIAMYQAKSAGRNRVRFFDPKLQQSVESRAALESDLRSAIANQQLQLHYQVQVGSDNLAVGAEALIRWIHPERGMVSPADFIPLAEESTLILEIGHWVLDTACRQVSEWANHELTSNLVLAVNISARQFMQQDFVDQVAAVLHKHGTDPSRLKLELTESVVLDDLDFVIAKMLALRQEIGVSLSLDDFGTGYSSLSYLKRLPLDQIKIDQSFVRDMKMDSSDAVMVKTIIDLTGNFGLEVIAEGVETDEQLELLRHYGCEAYQGYFFSKPLPLEEFEMLLKQS